MNDFPLLSVTTFLPLLGAAVIMLLGREQLARWMAPAPTLATLAVSVPLSAGFC